jgi:hypothetical protein
MIDVKALVIEPFRPKGTGDESIASFVERRLGPRMSDLVSAIIHGCLV